MTASQGNCGGTTCSLGAIADGGEATVSVVARATKTGDLVNTASVSQSDLDPVPANGTSQATVSVTAGGPPALPAPSAGEVNVTPAGGQGQCVALKNGGGVCAPLPDGQQIELKDIAYINPGTGAVELQGIEGVERSSERPSLCRRSMSRASAPRPQLRQAGADHQVDRGQLQAVHEGQESLCERCLGRGGEQQAKRKPVRRLWGKGKGRFRTRGRFSSGTVRGTNWLTQDFCEGTLTRVVEGTVSVYDLVAKKSILVKAGKSYFAKAGKIK